MLTALSSLAAALLLLVPARPAATGSAGRRRAERGVDELGVDGRDVDGVGTGARPGALLLPAAVLMVAAACVALAGPVHGAVAAAVGGPVVWVLGDRARRRPPRRPPDPDLPIVLDLVAAGLRAGRPPADAIARAAPAAGVADRADLLRVAGLLRLGADAERAWQAVGDGAVRQVAAVAVRSAASGIRVATAFENLAAELREQARAAAAVRAHRAGVQAMGPLAACFLPSFVCLGVVPVVVGIARHAFAVLP